LSSKERWLPNYNPSGIVSNPSVWISFPEPSIVLTGFVLLTTGIAKALDVSGDMTQEVHPKSSIHCKRKYRSS
jgi:hypothetical protein